MRLYTHERMKEELICQLYTHLIIMCVSELKVTQQSKITYICYLEYDVKSLSMFQMRPYRNFSFLYRNGWV